MADDGEGGGGSKFTMGGFIEPGIGIVKSWQGIVEISLRGVLIVSCPINIIADIVGGWRVWRAVVFFINLLVAEAAL